MAPTPSKQCFPMTLHHSYVYQHLHHVHTSISLSQQDFSTWTQVSATKCQSAL